MIINGFKTADSFLTLCAKDLGLRPYPDSLPVLINAVEDKIIAASVKNYLSDFFDAQTRVIFFAESGRREITLASLDCQTGYDESACVYIPQSLGYDKRRYCFGDLLRIISRLTAPDGCPWDKVQTHQSIRINLIEEAYEAVDAIDSGDKSAMIEELGDVLLQSVLHADIALRAGEFSIGDVITVLCRKLYTRHTHIFGADKAQDAAEALGFWEGAKAKEKQYLSLKQQLEKYPQNFAAALKAQKIFKKLWKEEEQDGEKQRNFSQKGYYTPVSLHSSKTFEGLSEALKLLCEKPTSEAAGKFLYLAVGLVTLCGFDSEVELNNYCRKLINEIDNRETF